MTKTKDILTILKSSGRTLSIDEEVAKAAPVNEGELEFFKLNRYVSDDEMEKEYEKRGLEPASLLALCLYDSEHRGKLDEMKYVGTHWKDEEGKWCFATFGLWCDVERYVYVDRGDGDWSDDWWFAGVRKSALKTKTLDTSPESLSALEQRVKKLEEIVDGIRGFLVL